MHFESKAAMPVPMKSTLKAETNKADLPKPSVPACFDGQVPSRRNLSLKGLSKAGAALASTFRTTQK